MKALLKSIFFGSKAVQGVNPRLVKSVRILLVTTALSGIIGLMPDIASKAQRPNAGNAAESQRSAATPDPANSEFDLSGLFSGLSVLGLIGAGLAGFFVIRRRRALAWEIV